MWFPGIGSVRAAYGWIVAVLTAPFEREKSQVLQRRIELSEQGWGLDKKYLELTIGTLEAKISELERLVEHYKAQVAVAEAQRDELKAQKEAVERRCDEYKRNEQLQGQKIQELEKRVHDLDAPHELDQLELLILGYLKIRPPANVITLAQVLGVEQSEVEYRVQRMYRLNLMWPNFMGPQGTDYTLTFKGRDLLHKKGM